MDRIRAWWADAQAWLAAATPRERRLIMLAGGGVLLFIVLVTYASFSAAIRRAETALDEKRADFEKISRLAAGHCAPQEGRQRPLRVRKTYENKELLDVSLTVSAWQGS